MTDLHTHILPGMDDGAPDVNTSLAMLREQQRQGVDTVVLTPHFYRMDESVGTFLSRRQASMDALQKALPDNAPRLIPGAEVAWYRAILEEPRIPELCIGDSRCLLLELPLQPWSETLLEQIYQLAGVMGVTPILAHVERYLRLQKQGQIETLQEMGIPMQLSAWVFQKPLFRGKWCRLLSRGTWFLGSDCHNMGTRPPNMGLAAPYIEKRLPNAKEILSWQP